MMEDEPDMYGQICNYFAPKLHVSISFSPWIPAAAPDNTNQTCILEIQGIVIKN